MTSVCKFNVYYPEMGETRPEADGYMTIGFRCDRYITTRKPLKGRGITLMQTYRPEDLTERGQWKAGYSQYRVTPRALQALRQTMAIASEALL